MRVDMERLALIRKKREDDRLKRIAEEGFDRYAPPAEGGRGGAPKDAAPGAVIEGSKASKFLKD